jgi:hypothetical protein
MRGRAGARSQLRTARQQHTSMLPWGSAFIVAAPGLQLAGHTSPCSSVNCMWGQQMRRRLAPAAAAVAVAAKGTEQQVVWWARGMPSGTAGQSLSK